jgi:hypothetical protein
MLLPLPVEERTIFQMTGTLWPSNSPIHWLPESAVTDPLSGEFEVMEKLLFPDDVAEIVPDIELAELTVPVTVFEAAPPPLASVA